MITMFRNFARSKWAIGLLVLLGLSLVFVGGQQVDVIGALSPPQVVKAGERSIDGPAFGRLVQGIRDRNQRETGQSVSNEDLAADPGFIQAFTQRAKELSLLAWAEKVGFRPDPELILRELRKQPAFFDPVTQQFNEEAYRARLAEAGLTPAEAEEQFRDEYVRVHYGTALAAGARLPRIYGAIVSNQTMQARDGRWFKLNPAMFDDIAAPTDAQLNEFLRQNASQWRQPELREASIIVFDNPTDGEGEIARKDIEDRFNFRKDALSLPEKRDFVTLTVSSKAAADRIAAALKAGQSPEQVAEANDIQAAPFNDAPRTAVTDPAVAAAVFGLGVNQVSDPVQARVGFVVARVSEITAGRPVTLADVESQIVQELRETRAKAKLLERVEAFSQARSRGTPVDQAVRETGARLIPLPPITREGQTVDRRPTNLLPQMLEQIWRVAPGQAGEVTPLDQSQFFAIQVRSATPAAMPALDEVRTQATAQWRARETARRLSARADELSARLRKGEDIAAVAASAGATVVSRQGVRQDQETVTELGQAVASGLFGGERGQPFRQQDQTGELVIGMVDRVIAPQPALAAQEALSWRVRLSQNIPQEFLTAVTEAAGQRYKAQFNVPQARTALGLPAEAPAAPAGVPASRP